MIHFHVIFIHNSVIFTSDFYTVNSFSRDIYTQIICFHISYLHSIYFHKWYLHMIFTQDSFSCDFYMMDLSVSHVIFTHRSFLFHMIFTHDQSFSFTQYLHMINFHIWCLHKINLCSWYLCTICFSLMINLSVSRDIYTISFHVHLHKIHLVLSYLHMIPLLSREFYAQFIFTWFFSHESFSFTIFTHI